MADNFNVVTANGTSIATFRATDVGGGLLAMMSIPTNTLGTALVGQNLMANSLPVAIASNQSAIPVSGTVTAVIGTVTAVVSGTVTAVVSNASLTALVSGTVTAVVSNASLTAVVSGTVTAVVSNASITASISNSFLPVAAATVPTLLTAVSTAGAPAAVAIKAAAGTLKLVTGYNNNTATPVFLKFYNTTAGGVLVGTTSPKLTVGFAPGAPFSVNFGDGAAFTSAMAYVITALIPDTDTTAVGIDDLHAGITFL